MHIIFVATSRIPSERAMATAIMKQCEGFVREGHTVTLVIPKRKNTQSENPYTYHGVEHVFRIERLPCIELPFGERVSYIIRQLTFLISAMFFLARYPNDAVLYSREPELLALIPTRKRKFIEIHHLYGLRHFGVFFLRRMNGIIAITHALREDLVQRYACVPNTIAVCPSGVSIKDFSNPESKHAARERLGLPLHVPIALYIGEFDEWKGVEVFTRAGAQLKENGILPVVIGGSDEEVRSYKAKYPAVLFLGRRPHQELKNNQQIADVLIIPNSSRFEISSRHTSPLKVFSAMASGVPIVASELPSMCEILTRNNARLVPPDNPDALTFGICETIQEREASYRRAQQALQEVTQYDWSTRSKRILTFITQYQQG